MMKTIAPIRIVLADDHEIFRDGFKVMIKKQPSVQLVGEAADGEELIRQTRQLRPDVVITDKEKFLWDNSFRFYGLPVPSSAGPSQTLLSR